MGNTLRLGIVRIGLTINKWILRPNSNRKNITILVLGLQKSGKSTIVQRIAERKSKVIPDTHYVQTKGFTTAQIKRRTLTINLNDLGGHESIQELWPHYYSDAHGIIYVVNTSGESCNGESSEFDKSTEVFKSVLNDLRVRRKPVLILGNKQDLEDSISEMELTHRMDLLKVVNAARCMTRVDMCSAYGQSKERGRGIFEGFRWLINHIASNYQDLNERVTQQIVEEKEKCRIERIRLQEEISPLKRIKDDEGVLCSSSSMINPATTERPSPEGCVDENEFNGNNNGVDNPTFVSDNPEEPSAEEVKNKKESEGRPDSSHTKRRRKRKVGPKHPPPLLHAPSSPPQMTKTNENDILLVTTKVQVHSNNSNFLDSSSVQKFEEGTEESTLNWDDEEGQKDKPSSFPSNFKRKNKTAPMNFEETLPDLVN